MNYFIHLSGDLCANPCVLFVHPQRADDWMVFSLREWQIVLASASFVASRLQMLRKEEEEEEEEAADACLQCSLEQSPWTFRFVRANDPATDQWTATFPPNFQLDDRIHAFLYEIWCERTTPDVKRQRKN